MIFFSHVMDKRGIRHFRQRDEGEFVATLLMHGGCDFVTTKHFSRHQHATLDFQGTLTRNVRDIVNSV
jgi:hypothetical protein